MKWQMGRCAMAAWAAAGILAMGAVSAARADLRAEMHEISTRLFSMGDRVISEREWNDLMVGLDDIDRRAKEAGDRGVALETVVARARAWGDLARNPAYAVSLLGAARNNARFATVPELRQVYLTEAEMLSRTGDADAIRRLIVAFKGSPLYDPSPLVYSVPDNGSPTMTMVRPRSPQTESPLVLGMMRHLNNAKVSVGARIPDYVMSDIDGASYSPGSLQGRVVLLDFWVAGSVPWERTVPFIQQAREIYGARGFEAIGISQNLDAQGIRSFVAGRPGMTWPQVEGRTMRSLILQLGIPGESANFLLDRQGRIRGRNLRGSALLEAVGGLLAEP